MPSTAFSADLVHPSWNDGDDLRRKRLHKAGLVLAAAVAALAPAYYSASLADFGVKLYREFFLPAGAYPVSGDGAGTPPDQSALGTHQRQTFEHMPMLSMHGSCADGSTAKRR